jgi:hypothetical protein
MRGTTKYAVGGELVPCTISVHLYGILKTRWNRKGLKFKNNKVGTQECARIRKRRKKEIKYSKSGRRKRSGRV